VSLPAAVAVDLASAAWCGERSVYQSVSLNRLYETWRATCKRGAGLSMADRPVQPEGCAHQCDVEATVLCPGMSAG